MIIRCLYDKLVPINELKKRFHPKNRNQHPKEQIERLAKILKYQGVRYCAKVSNRSDLITSGHGRVLAAEFNGWTEYPVNFQDYDSEDQEYADLQADNAVAAWAELDLSGINLDLGDLGPDFDIDLLGIKDFVIEPFDKFPEEIQENERDQERDDEDEPEDRIPDKIEPRVKEGESYHVGAHQVLNGDCLKRLKELKSHSIDSLVTDPPAGISFMGKEWDEDKGGRDQWIAWLSEVMKEALRVLKPGAHGLVWAIPRTSHWTATALEEAGFEIRDVVTHLFGSGFPKSLDISKAIDKAAGAEREVIGSRKADDIRGGNLNHRACNGDDKTHTINITAPSTPEAKRWQGFGTALKPACEMWILVRKPLGEKTVASNVLKHGTGGINIDASRIGFSGPNDMDPRTGKGIMFKGNSNAFKGFSEDIKTQAVFGGSTQGRFPANLVLSHNLDCVQVGQKKVKGISGGGDGNATSIYSNDVSKNRGKGKVGFASEDGTETVAAWECTEGCAVAELDRQSGNRPSAGQYKDTTLIKDMNQGGIFGVGSNRDANGRPTQYANEQGGASRFFYCAKASKSERNAGCEGLEEKELPKDGPLEWGVHGQTGKPNKPVEPRANHHPTVKPVKLMQYLVRLVTPPEGKVLDCFAGSGSTLIACHMNQFEAVLIEQSPEYCDIILARAEHFTEKSAMVQKEVS